MTCGKTTPTFDVASKLMQLRSLFANTAKVHFFGNAELAKMAEISQAVGLGRFCYILLSLSKAGYETSQPTVRRHRRPVQKTGSVH